MGYTTGCLWCRVCMYTTGYVHHGEIIMNPRAARLHYLRHWFVMDLLSAFPWCVVALVLPRLVHTSIGGGWQTRALTCALTCAMTHALIRALTRAMIRALTCAVAGRCLT